jgi:hypothetical protein
MVSNVEPLLPPPRQTSQEPVGDVLLFHPLPQLQSGTTDFIHGTLAGLWFEMEEVAEEVEVGFYPQEGFTEMNKDGNVENRIGVEVIELDAIIEEKTMEEIRCGEGQPVFKKILKKSWPLRMFFCQECHWIISLGYRRHSSTIICRSALDNLLVLHLESS